MSISDHYHGYPDGMPMPTGSGGIELLRRKRGDEHVSFADVADHLKEYVRLHPPDFAVIDRMAKYLSDIET